ncbi:MAG: DUF4912 domain-containing protein [Chthoniobacterales bacterium]
MAFTIRQTSEDSGLGQLVASASDAAFRISAEPVVEESAPAPASADQPAEEQLPRTYGTQTLCVMPRDPRTLFAYWDIDWEKAFAGDPPRDRKVHLRVRTAAEVEETSIEVEPLAGSCFIEVRPTEDSYRAEIGYYQPADVWNSVAQSDAVSPPQDSATLATPDFATVPFHLSFQRMLDLLRVSNQKSESLMAMLSALRERASAVEANQAFTALEREMVEAVDRAVAEQPARAALAESNGGPDLWVRQSVERVLGLGGFSPAVGFGGSSRAA